MLCLVAEKTEEMEEKIFEMCSRINLSGGFGVLGH